MTPRSMLLLAVALGALGAPASAVRAEPAEPEARPALPTIAVTDFGGSDGALGGFLAETLQTALGQSGGLRLAGCSDVRRARGGANLRAGTVRWAGAGGRR